MSEVTVEGTRDYAYGLAERGLRLRTRRGRLHPLRGLLALAVERGWRADNPALVVKLPKKDAARRDTVADDKLKQLLAGCHREPNPRRRAMIRAVLSVLISAGLRQQELLDLRIDDIDRTQRSVLIRSGKGSKSRAVPVSQARIDAVREWLAVRGPTHHSYLFLIDPRRRLGENGLRRLLQSAQSLADLDDHPPIRCHTIRHAVATRLHRKRVDLRSIQVFLGHSELQTTAQYLHTDELQLQKIGELTDLSASDRGRPGAGSRGGPWTPAQRQRRIPKPVRKEQREGER